MSCIIPGHLEQVLTTNKQICLFFTAKKELCQSNARFHRWQMFWACLGTNVHANQKSPSSALRTRQVLQTEILKCKEKKKIRFLSWLKFTFFLALWPGIPVDQSSPHGSNTLCPAKFCSGGQLAGDAGQATVWLRLEGHTEARPPPTHLNQCLEKSPAPGLGASYRASPYPPARILPLLSYTHTYTRPLAYFQPPTQSRGQNEINK